MLTAVGYWQSVRAWHVIGYDDLAADPPAVRARVERRFTELGLRTREVDAVRTAADTPEEYGFILDNHGYGPALTPRSLPFFREICGRIQNVCGGERSLLLKNPWDFGNGATICRLIPSARFVYIHRQPLHVIGSMWRFLRRALLQPLPYVALLSDRYRRLAGSRWRLAALRLTIRHAPGLWVRYLIAWSVGQARRFLASAAELPGDRRVDIAYETLCAEPDKTLAHILRTLQIPAAEVSPAAELIGRHTSAVDPLVARQQDYLRRRMARYLNFLRSVP
jgi:hypothetical protein